MNESLSRARILVVDDDEHARAALGKWLRSEGVGTIATAEDGFAAIQHMTATPFDLVFLDVHMPRLGGVEVLEILQREERLRQVPVIVVSGDEDMQNVIRCIQAGAVDYLPKPVNPVLLRARLASTLDKKWLQDEVFKQAEQLAGWNRQLEQRVQEQIAQLDRLGRLKRFFSPQLAESIVDGGGEDLLKTHRREVVVVFLDLRGFTAFTDAAEPEEVMSVLAQYHRAMGELVVANEGTLERFAGDAMMVFFNDPIRLANPAANAVRMAVAMQARFGPLRTGWKRSGHDLDLGIGIAQGYATLGAIGFEGRWDYACIGSVSNVAARLCSEARGGQILTNEKTLAGIENIVSAEPLGEFTLKGIPHPLPVFSITDFKE